MTPPEQQSGAAPTLAGLLGQARSRATAQTRHTQATRAPGLAGSGTGGGDSTAIHGVLASDLWEIAQSGPDCGGYGLLSGDVDGTNTVFTVPGGSYTPGGLLVFWRNQLRYQGSGALDFKELDSAAGQIEFGTPPKIGDKILILYRRAR